jgi:hypothetical protein
MRPMAAASADDASRAARRAALNSSVSGVVIPSVWPFPTP